MGADIVKVPYTGSPETFREVTQGCASSVVIAGGEKMASDEEVLRMVTTPSRRGARGPRSAGTCSQHRSPASMVRAIVSIVHGGATVREALGILKANLETSPVDRPGCPLGQGNGRRRHRIGGRGALGAGRPRLVRPGTGARRDGVRRGELREGTDFRVTRMEGRKTRRGSPAPPGRGLGRHSAGPRDHPPREPCCLGSQDPGRGPDARDVSLYRVCWRRGFMARPRCPGSRRDAYACGRRPREGGGRIAGSARVVEVVPLGMGDRVCVDTCTWIEGSRGLLVGTGARGCSSCAPKTYRTRMSFRARSASTRGRSTPTAAFPGAAPPIFPTWWQVRECSSSTTPGGERRRGSAGRRWSAARWCWSAPVGPSGNEHSIVLQNAETIRLVGPGGATPSIARIAAGDEVLLMEERAGRHFGVAVEETIREK